MQKHSQKFFSTRVYGFSDLRNFFFFFLCFVSLRAIDMLFAYDFAFFSHSFTHSLARSPARCHLVLQTYSALIAIMSCELYSISISLIFSIFFGLGFLVCDFNQNALMRVAKRETFSSVYEICIFNKLNRIQKPAESLPPIESLSNFKHK